MNKKIMLSVVMASAISMGALVGCNNTAKTNDTAKSEETSSFIEDHKGFYYYTNTEEIEGNEVKYTNGYRLDGDGTGVVYGQDTLDFTWDETGIHFPDRTEAFTLEQGKLIVDGIEYKKLNGNFISPNPSYVDVENIEDGVYHANIGEPQIEESEGKTTIRTGIYTVETFDIVDINNMTEGDAISVSGRVFCIDSIEKTPSGIININGGIENQGTALIADDESNCFVHVGMDMEKSYTNHGFVTLAVNDDVKFIDGSNPTEEKEYKGKDAIVALKELLKKSSLTENNCTITVKNGEIIEINRFYTP